VIREQVAPVPGCPVGGPDWWFVVAGGALFVHLLGSALLRATDRSLLNAATPLMQTVADPGMPDLPDPSGRAASTGLVT